MGQDSLDRRLIGIWKGLKPPQRVAVALVALLLIAGLVTLALTANSDATVRIVGPEGASQDRVAEALARQGIGFTVRPDGLYVTRETHERALMQLFSEGVIDDTEVFDKVFEGGPLTTSRERTLKYQLALQERLERMIRSLDSIDKASVQVTHAAFSKVLGSTGGVPAKASVVLQLVPGRAELSVAEVNGIANLVAAGVRGLEPVAVKIMDRTGRPYLHGEAATRWTAAPERRELGIRYEKAFEEKVVRHLLPAYPEVIVSAFVKLSDRSVQIRRTEESNRVQGPMKGSYEPVSIDDDPRFKGVSTLSDTPYENEEMSTRTQVTENEDIGPGTIEKASLAITIPVPEGREMPTDEARIAAMAGRATGIPAGNITVRTVRLPAAPVRTAEAAPVFEFEWMHVGIGLAILLSAVAALLAFRRTKHRPRTSGARIEELRDFVRRRLGADLEHGAQVLGGLDSERAALVLSQLDTVTSARLMERVDRSVLHRIVAAAARLREKPARASERAAVLTRVAESLVAPRAQG